MITAWLIEDTSGARPRWWCGANGWTTDVNIAIRMQREEDAMAAIVALAADDVAIATEHMWSDAIAGGHQPMPEPEPPRVPMRPEEGKAVAWAVVGMYKDTELRDDDDRRVDALVYMDALEAMNHGREDCRVLPLVLAGIYDDPPGIFTAQEYNLRRKLDERNADCQRLAGALSEVKARIKHLEAALEAIGRAERHARIGR